MSEMNKEAQAQTQAEPEITLTLTPDEVAAENEKKLAELEEQVNPAAVKDPLAEMKLTEAERKTVEDFSKKIDITESNTILQYGSAAQKKVTDFSNTALQNVRTKDLGEIGSLLSNLVVELKTTDDDEKKGFFDGLFGKGKDKVTEYKAKYDKAEVNVEKIAGILEDHQITLLKDIALLDELYARNAQNTKEPEDAQAANDLSEAITRFEKKLHDLELTRTVSIQMAPQIRLVQNNDTLMTEKIQSTLVNTIPLWKNQIVLSLGIEHSKQAMEAEREVTNMTNDLLKKNAETLHQATVDVAKESERGIVDIETLQHTNEQLIATLDEVLQIQKEGHEKREAAELELRRIENQLTDKLLQINNEKDITKR